MKIATWNVNSIRSRLDHALQWLDANPVDVLCLQETKVVDELFPRSPFESLGYHLYISGQKSYNGVALISRDPLENVSCGFAGMLSSHPEYSLDFLTEVDIQKRVITGVLKGVRILNLYVPNGSAVGSDKYLYKLQWLKVLYDYVQTCLAQGDSLCICGDFNIALEDRDIHNPARAKDQIMASEPERQALQQVLNLGLADAFRKFTSEAGHYSWWDYRNQSFQRDRGWRIDHHYLTPDLYAKATNCQIDITPRKLEQPSDHTPVIVEF